MTSMLKVPEGMTEEEVLATIEKVSNVLARNATFGYFDEDDIKQESFFICAEALEAYDNKRPLENFLYTHLKNRLKNFKRDNLIRPIVRCKNCKGLPDKELCDSCVKRLQLQRCKMLIMYPNDIYKINENERSISADSDPAEDLYIENIISLIDEHLDVSFRADYLRIRDDVYVPQQRYDKIMAEIRRIVEEHGYTAD